MITTTKASIAVARIPPDRSASPISGGVLGLFIFMRDVCFSALQRFHRQDTEGGIVQRGDMKSLQSRDKQATF